MAYMKGKEKAAYDEGLAMGHYQADKSMKDPYVMDTMHSRCIKEQNKYHKEQSSHGMPAQGK